MRRRELLVAGAGAFAASCGYSLQGRGITTDASVKRIGVPLFKDRTGKLGLDTHVTQAVMVELLKRGRFTVVRDAAGVDALVEGEILAFNVLPVGFSSDTGLTQATRYAISMTASVVYRKIGQSEPIWSNESFSQRDEYDMSETSQNYFDREEQSIERLSTAFARSLVAAMLEAF
jgi:Lipopolysaccharide-assembly